MDSDRSITVGQKRIALALILLGAILIALNLTVMSKIEWGVIVIGLLCIALGIFGGIDPNLRRNEE